MSGSKPVETALKALAKPFEDKIDRRAQTRARSEAAGSAEYSEGQTHAGAEAPGLRRRCADQAGLGRSGRDHAGGSESRARARCATQLHEIEATAPDPLPQAYAYVNTGEAAPQSYVLRMGDPHNRLDPVEPAVPYVLRAGYTVPAERRPADGIRELAGVARKSADRARDGRIASGSSAWATAWCARRTTSARWATSRKATRCSTGSPRSSWSAAGASRRSTG